MNTTHQAQQAAIESDMLQQIMRGPYMGPKEQRDCGPTHVSGLSCDVIELDRHLSLTDGYEMVSVEVRVLGFTLRHPARVPKGTKIDMDFFRHWFRESMEANGWIFLQRGLSAQAAGSLSSGPCPGPAASPRDCPICGNRGWIVRNLGGPNCLVPCDCNPEGKP